MQTQIKNIRLENKINRVKNIRIRFGMIANETTPHKRLNETKVIDPYGIQ